MVEDSILVVDDEERMRKLIKDFLNNKGYHILEAEDGEKALEVYEENQSKIMLILLDVMMPKLDGWSVLRQIRQKNKDVPIIMLTARGEEQDELFGFELGVDEYEILATLDNRTSEICRHMDGKVFKTSDLQVGINHPPFHCRCRTTSVPYFDEFTKDETRAARDENGKYYTVPADMKYPEWKSKYVDEPKEKEYNKFKEQVKKNIKENYNLSLNKGQQDKHIVGTNNYIEGRSILTADPQELIDMYAGEGFFFQKRNGDWKERTWFEHDDVIGKYIDKDGNSIETTKGIIHYSKRKGVHVVPSNPKGEYMI